MAPMSVFGTFRPACDDFTRRPKAISVSAGLGEIAVYPKNIRRSAAFYGELQTETLRGEAGPPKLCHASEIAERRVVLQT